MRLVLMSWLAGAGACALAVVLLAASGVETAYVIIGSVVIGVAVFLGVALALDRFLLR